MPTATAAGRGLAPPLAPHVHQHQVRGTEEKPNKLVLLAPLSPRDTHFIPRRGIEDAHSVPCKGEDCKWPHEKFPLRVNYYGPALLAREAEESMPEAWVRVVLFVPQAALKQFTNVRGAFHHCHRKKNESDRGHRVVAKCVGFCHEVAEPSFEVQPLLDLVWKEEGAVESVLHLRQRLSPNVTPPVFHRPRPAVTADQVAALNQRIAELERQQEAERQERIKFLDMLQQSGQWPGSSKKPTARVTGEPLENYRASIARNHDVTPGSNGTHKPEGGDE